MDKWVRSSIVAGSLLAGSGVFYHYVFYLPERDRARASEPAAAIVAVPGLDFTPDILTAGTVGVPYSQMFTPSGGTDEYVFALARGTPPPGLSVGADGSVTGTPTTVGSYQFVVRLTAGNQVIERLITLFIDATALDLTPSTLPDGNVGQNYSQVLVPSGGTAPFLFQVNSMLVVSRSGWPTAMRSRNDSHTGGSRCADAGAWNRRKATPRTAIRCILRLLMGRLDSGG